MRRTLTSFFLCMIGSSLLLFTFGRSAQAAGEGETLYKQRCAGCHAPDGSGNTTIGKNLKVPDLRSAAVQKKSDADIAKIIQNGGTRMPPVGKTLKPNQVKDLVAYVRSLGKKK